MVVFGAVFNGLTTFAAGLAGALCKKAIPKKVGETVMQMMALVVLYIGLDGCISDGKKIKYAAIIVILSLAIGTLIGEIIDINRWLNALADKLQQRFASDGKVSLAEGFVNASLLISVGAMSITGAIDGGIAGDHSTLIIKSIIDIISCFIMAGTLGIGVAFAGVFVFVYEGSIALSASLLGSVLTDSTIAAMGCVGNLLLVGVALTMLGKKIRVVNCVPAILIAIPIELVAELIIK